MRIEKKVQQKYFEAVAEGRKGFEDGKVSYKRRNRQIWIYSISYKKKVSASFL